jgi:tRNA (guanosine-2'-O-)-methyltransferase
MDEGLIEYLSGFVTPQRINNFSRVLNFRTRYFTVVLEDIYQSHNASAVLRSCDCFGIQDVHIIENRNEYNINPDVTLGSNKWLNIHRHNQKENNTIDTIDELRKNNYRIIATSPHEKKEIEIENFDLTRGKAAFIFGSELKGISDAVKDEADEFLKIPMYGFTESFNISVSAAIVLHDLVTKLHRSEVLWQLTDTEKQEIIFNWLKKTIKHSELLENEYYQTINHRKK